MTPQPNISYREIANQAIAFRLKDLKRRRRAAHLELAAMATFCAAAFVVGVQVGLILNITNWL